VSASWLVGPQSSSGEIHQVMEMGEKIAMSLALQRRLLERHWVDEEEVWLEVQQERVLE